MEKVSRRKFIGDALLAGAGTTLLRDVSTADLVGASPKGEVDDFDPGFVAGRVVDKPAESVLTVEDADGKLQTLVIDEQSRVWKAGRWTDTELLVGDCAYVSGSRDANYRLVVDRSWASISNVHARVVGVKQDAVSVELKDGVAFEFLATDVTQLETSSGFVQADSNSLAQWVKPGSWIQVVASGDAGKGYLTATRMFPAPTEPPKAILNSEAERLELVPCHVTFTGMSTWFCCGGVTGCGAGSQCPGGTSGGACGGCRSDRHHMAWPKIGTSCRFQCGQGCNDCCAGQIDLLSCGDDVTCQNPCNGNSVVCSIKDCGPCVHCTGSIGCTSRTKITFDLTPCAFNVLGNLDAGKINVDATYTIPGSC